MRIVIDHSEFQRLSPGTQRELLEHFAGPAFLSRPTGRATPRLKWRQPVDLTPDQAVRLVHGLTEDHRRRLALFARKDGRVRVKEILALTGDRDLRATSDFQKTITRRLRRMIDDPEKKAQLIGWDFDATKWDANQTTIVDGIYYVSDATAQALRACLGPDRRRAKGEPEARA